MNWQKRKRNLLQTYVFVETEVISLKIKRIKENKCIEESFLSFFIKVFNLILYPINNLEIKG